MNRFSLAGAFAVAALLGVALESQASGGLFRRNGCCEAPCAPAPCASAPCAPAPVQYEERKVKVCKTVIKEKEIDVMVCRQIMKEVPYNYTVCVPVMKPEERMVTVCTPISKQVPCVYTVMVPRTIEKKVLCTTYKCETMTIVEKVPVCKTICVTTVDECGRCCTHRERVTEWVEQTRCVVKRIPITVEKTVLCTICEAVQKPGMKTVCEIVKTQEKITVNVCHYEQKPCVGKRLVCETVKEMVKRKVCYCETILVDEIIRVPVCTPCAPCSDCGTTYHGGLFRRGCCN